MRSEGIGVPEDENVVEEKELIRFEKAEEYLSLLRKLLSSNSASSTSSSKEESALDSEETLAALVAILDEYQEQSYLLDPYLEHIVAPTVVALQKNIPTHSSISSSLHDDSHAKHIQILSKLVYQYTKVRGYKTITNFFPHEVADLPATLNFLEGLTTYLTQPIAPAESSTSHDFSAVAQCWELRYVALLWLSLICMIPFDLSKFDRSDRDAAPSTAARIEAIGTAFITCPGKERDAAAVLLGKLFQRQDVKQQRFDAFVRFALEILQDPKPSPFAATGILQALCEIVKTSDSHFVTSSHDSIQSILDLYDDPAKPFMPQNGLVVKYRTKLTNRLALKLLRPRRRSKFVKFRTLGAMGDCPQETTSSKAPVRDDDDESDVPAEIDDYIARLLEALQHKDTVVRYSAAKGLARLCDRLPTSFISQVSDAIVSLFQINIPDLYEGANDLSSVSEHTWQGACMALAELARRGLLFAEGLGEKLVWIEKALLFDIRRGAHSVGSNVRDSACYIVWALARAHDPEAIRPYALSLANRLMAVATLDRDVSIRRAASAAFQESVGRLNLFPHGIEVIRLTDFYSVSIRRNAFLECAVQVAKLQEYQEYLVHHLLNVTIVHWDPPMRKLGAQALALIASHDTETLIPQIVRRLASMVQTTDNAVLHGALLSLAEICERCQASDGEDDTLRSQAFAQLDTVPSSVFRSMGAALVLQASCQLIGAGISSSSSTSADDSQTWQKILNIALARQEEYVQLAAAEAIHRASCVLDLTPRIRAILDGWTSFSPTQQQSNALALGATDYGSHAASFESAIRHLISLVDPNERKGVLYSSNIETRRNAFDSLTRAVVKLDSELAHVCTAETLELVIKTMLVGLNDYTSDQRGDVGSWVRLSCVEGIRSILTLLNRFAIVHWLPEATFQSAIGALWKQSTERIDQIRQTAGRSVLAVYRVYGSSTTSARPLGYDLVAKSFGALLPSTDTPADVGVDEAASAVSFDFTDSKRAFPRLASLLQIPAYRQPILEGLVISIGSKSDLGERVVGPALFEFLASQHEAVDQENEERSLYLAGQLLEDLFILSKKNFGNNRVFVPAIQTFNLLIENGVLDLLASLPGRTTDILYRTMKMTTTNITKIKAINRVNASAVLTANLFPAIGKNQQFRSLILSSLSTFLAHPYPTTRAKTAEQLYFALSTSSISSAASEAEEWEELETILLDTKWATAKRDNFAAEAEKVIELVGRIDMPPS